MTDPSPVDILSRAIPGILQRTPEWLATRRTGIGGSDAPAVLGLSPWSTPYEVWVDKTGDQGGYRPKPEPISEAMKWGVLLERAILEEYGRHSRFNMVRAVGMLRHPDIPWLICSPDAVAGDRLVEVKTTRSSAGWGEQDTDEIPLHHLVQCHHNLIVSGAAVVDVPVLIAGQDYRLYHVEPDPRLHERMIEQEAEFWRRVRDLDPPPPKNTGDAFRRWGRASRAGSVFASREAIEAISLMRQYTAEIKMCEQLVDEQKTKLMTVLGDNGDTLLDDSGNVLATWRVDRGRKGYTVEPKEPSRRFLLKEAAALVAK